MMETNESVLKERAEREDRIKNVEQIFIINSDPGKAERHRKEWLYGKGTNSVMGSILSIWNHLRKTNKRIDELEDRLKELDGISMPRHIARPPVVKEYHIERFLPDE